MTRNPIRRVSAKRRRSMRKWSEITAQAICDAGGCCQAGLEGCTHRATEGHHRKLRSQGGGDELSNCIAVCHACHMRLHAQPRLAAELGLMESQKSLEAEA